MLEVNHRDRLDKIEQEKGIWSMYERSGTEKGCGLFEKPHGATGGRKKINGNGKEEEVSWKRRSQSRIGVIENMRKNKKRMRENNSQRREE